MFSSSLSDLMKSTVVNESLSTTSTDVLFQRISTNFKKVVSTFPLPKIQELLSRLNNCKYFSFLDSCSGYYLIGLTEEAKKTAFVMVDGK